MQMVLWCFTNIGCTKGKFYCEVKNSAESSSNARKHGYWNIKED